MNPHLLCAVRKHLHVVQRLITAMVLLYCVQSAVAQWYTDPDNPRLAIPLSLFKPAMCTDGSNGAFFAVGWTNMATPPSFLGHINRAGDLSYGEAPPPYPNLLPLDSLELYYQGAYSLTPSQPRGTVIAITSRVWFDNENTAYFGGLSFTKYDTVGRTGFRQVVITDTTHTIHGKLAIDVGSEGAFQVHSDGQGGLHMIVTSTQHFPPDYYNRLRSDGQFDYPWPGRMLTDGQYGEVLTTVEDGYGGILVFVRWHTDSPRFPGQITYQRFNHDGQPAFQTERQLPRPDLSYGWCIQSEPGRILVMQDSLMTSERVTHRVFLLDTNGTNLWEQQGRLLAPESGNVPIYLRADKQGGFFHTVRLPGDSLWTSHRYNGSAEHIAQSPRGTRTPNLASLADGTGGVYDVNWNSDPFEQPHWISVRHWGADFQPDWPDTILAFHQSHDGYDMHTVNQIVTEDHAVLGAAPWAGGLALFRVNPSGSLGPGTYVPLRDGSTMPDQFQIVSAYPNPFNGPVRIQFQAKKRQQLSLVVYDVLGRIVAKEPLRWSESGVNDWTWTPQEISSGNYYITFESAERRINQDRRTVIRGTYLK